MQPEIGVYLREAAPLIDLVKRLQIRGYELINGEEALPDRDRVTVYLCNHGAFLSPLPAPMLTADYLLAQGGYDDLITVSLFHRVVELLPGFSAFLRRYAGHSTPELHTVSGLVELMKARRFHIIGTAPEGRSCVWSFDQPVGPFTKFGLMKAALEADADIVLTAQQGIERFGRHVRLPAGLRLPIPGQPRGLLLPTWVPGRLTFVRVKYQRYQPLMTAAERAALPDSDHRARLDEEFGRIHRQLSQLYESLPPL